MKIHKSILFIVLYFLLSSIAGFSLESFVGVRAGAVAATFSGTDYENLLAGAANERKIKIGATGGFFYELVFNNRFSLQPELLFTMTGTSYGNDGELRNTIYINALSLPVLACYSLELKAGSIKLFAGLEASMALGSITLVNKPTGTKTDYSTTINRFAAGLIVGGGYSFPVPTGYVLADIRYIINVTPVYWNWGKDNTHQHNLALSLGYAYHF